MSKNIKEVAQEVPIQEQPNKSLISTIVINCPKKINVSDATQKLKYLLLDL